MKKQWISILIVGMAMGTSWAIRGQFGHEQGAAWAGGIGALSLILVSKRKDWYSKIMLIALSSAIGWGAGGMISYGVVVGYGRSVDLFNAFYGLLMLFVIGGLFGLLGGGLVGLTLESSKQKRVKWSVLIAEMVAGGLIIYYFLIEQLGWLMTPPRSEAWAICLGAGLAMIWYMARNNYHPALRVALFSSMGAGFGFAFGNFLQILGNVLEIDFNMWNVMEYSIGFFSGSSMAYGVFSSKWPEEIAVPKRWENKTAFLIVFVLIPLTVYIESPRLYQTLLGKAGDLQNPDNISLIGSLTSLIAWIAVALISWVKTMKSKKSIGRKEVWLLFVLYLSAYIISSYCVTGVFKGLFMLNHHLYVVNFIVVLILLWKRFPACFEDTVSDFRSKTGMLYLIVLVTVILLLALIAINIHGEMGGAHMRFPSN
ncbi:MAG: hypothetical protein Q8N05_13190 [Bacteroidota bacterium]|nr:hypothetical protein [Bacteroidota bacterium]